MMLAAVSGSGLRPVHFGQFQLALMLLLQDHGHAQRMTSRSSSVYVNGPVCPIGCSSCSKLNGCVTCRGNYVLHVRWYDTRQMGSCVRECPIGFFAVTTNKGDKCIKCGSHRCELCTNSTTCTRCHQPFALHHGQCLVTCPPEQPYFIETSGLCVSQLNCEVGHWSPWSECRRNGIPVCGSKRGRQKRQRPIVQHPTARGQQCLATIEFRKCRTKHRSCEDLSTSSNASERVSKAPNQSSSRRNRNWFKLALKSRNRKQKERPTDVAYHEGGRRQQVATTGGEQQRNSYHRRRVDINLIESREN